MRTFIYTYNEVERPKRNGHTYKTVRIFRIKRNKPVFVAEATDTFVDPFQLVLQTLEEKKALPRKAFARNPASNSCVYGTAWAMKEAGIADIQRIS